MNSDKQKLRELLRQKSIREEKKNKYFWKYHRGAEDTLFLIIVMLPIINLTESFTNLVMTYQK